VDEEEKEDDGRGPMPSEAQRAEAGQFALDIADAETEERLLVVSQRIAAAGLPEDLRRGLRADYTVRLNQIKDAERQAGAV